MATSPNYGWAEPDNSSLVKNGAQDIRALGDAIDTSLWNVGFGQAGKNRIINGDFGIWQRGTSFTLTNESYVSDRFKTQTDKTGTISRQIFTAGTAPVAGYEGQFYLRSALNAVGSYYILNQPIEDVRTFAGNTITLSFWARVSSGTASNAPEIIQNFGSGGSASVTTTPTGQTITTDWQRFSVSVSIPSITGKTIGTSSSLEIRVLRFVSAAAATIDIWGVQLEYGSKATPFETATGTIQGELAACQRYYQAPSLTPAALMIYGGSASGGFSANAYNNFTFPVQMRTTPTVTFYAHDGSAGQVTLYVSSSAIKSTSVASIGLQPWGWSGNFSGTGWGTNADSGLLAYGYKAEAEL